jgi:hypothetical protein
MKQVEQSWNQCVKIRKLNLLGALVKCDLSNGFKSSIPGQVILQSVIIDSYDLLDLLLGEEFVAHSNEVSHGYD